MMRIKYYDINKNVCEGNFIGIDKNQFGRTFYIVDSLEHGTVGVPARFVISIENENSILNETLLEEVNLSVRTFNVLKRGGFLVLEEVAESDFETLLALRNMSLKCLREIAEAIRNLNDKLASKISMYVDIQKKAIAEKLQSEELQIEIEKIINLNKKANNRKVNLLINLAINNGASAGEKQNSINLCKNILGL